jgi:hypothetical protein
MRRYRIALSALLLIITGGLLLREFNRTFLCLWNANSVTVSAERPLNAKKVTIEYGASANSISRENDAALFENRGRYTVIFDGKKKNVIPNIYGENDFLVTYDTSFYTSFRHFKTNRRNQHDYSFRFRKEKDDIFLDVYIAGNDETGFSRKMMPISLAGSLRGGNPVRK